MFWAQNIFLKFNDLNSVGFYRILLKYPRFKTFKNILGKLGPLKNSIKKI